MDLGNLFYSIVYGALALLIYRLYNHWLADKKGKSEGFSKEITQVPKFTTWMLIAFFIILSIVYLIESQIK